MMHELVVRLFEDDDAEAAAQIFYDAINIGAAEFYNATQRNAWASHVPETGYWCARMNAQMTYVATLGNEIVGYMTLANSGYIDLAFVAPNHIGTGVAKALYDAVMLKALELGVSRLYCEASFLAKRFFERQGWLLIKQQVIERSGIKLNNFVMEKHLI